MNRKAMKFPFKEANVQEVWSHKEMDVRRKLQVDHWMHLKNGQTGKCARIKLKTAGKITEVWCVKDLQRDVLNSIDKRLCTIGRPRHEVKKHFPRL